MLEKYWFFFSKIKKKYEKEYIKKRNFVKKIKSKKRKWISNIGNRTLSNIFGDAPWRNRYAAHCAEPKCAQTCRRDPPACLNPETKHFFI